MRIPAMNSLVTFRAAVVALFLTALVSCGESTAPADAPGDSQQNPHPELVFFNSLSGELEIALTAPTENIGNLANQRAPADARIKSLKLVAEVFEENSHTARQLTAEELSSVAFQGASIQLRGEGKRATTHQAPNGKYFTVLDLLNAVEEAERQSRGNSEWFGGVDVHHVFFEGIHLADDGVWDIYWGS